MKLAQYFRECSQEMKKVSWPKKDEVVSSVKVVLVITLLTALFLGLVDSLLVRLFTLVF